MKPKRNYSTTTIKVLFGLSGGQCAYPACTNTVIEPATENSDAFVSAHICHIYAINEDGPRGKPGLTSTELNSPENLILLCRHHHGIVDGQYETYPTEMLKEWKQAHENGMQTRFSANQQSVQPDLLSHCGFPTALVDQKIEQEVDILRKSRFFGEFDTIRSSLALGRRVVEGELSGGTDEVKSKGLAWCARLLSLSDHLNTAQEYLQLAERLGIGSEIDIANAFITSKTGDKNSALKILANIDSPTSRSAALMVVAIVEGPEVSLDWLRNAGIEASDLDPEGKYFLLNQQLVLAQWEAAKATQDAVSDQDLDDVPILHRMMAITSLLDAIPTELRHIVLNQLPFGAADFPMASDTAAMDALRVARRRFLDAAAAAQELSCPITARMDDEYALWIELRDPDQSHEGRRRLEAKLGDPKSALSVVNLGIQFGVNLDLEAVDREIERQLVINGGMTPETALARFALAFTQKTPENVANYISRFRDDLAGHIDINLLRFRQIEMLSQAGLLEKANECLASFSEEGISDSEVSRLRQLILEAEGTDSIGVRKEQFRKTDSLEDLVNLVAELGISEQWDDACEFGEILFQRTHSVRDAERLAHAFSNARRTLRLIEFIKTIPDLLIQSKNLQMAYSWSLFHEGALLEARSELSKLTNGREDSDYRNLQVNLGISIGDWNFLSAFVGSEYLDKDKRSAHELLRAAQIALNLGTPNANQLIYAAAASGNEDAGVLAEAYRLASRAGFEAESEVWRWLQKAAELSGDDGPIQKMELKDIFDGKPEWDRRESETYELLSRGEIPMFIAAQSINKSLVDLMLFPALANLSEVDPRRRGAISAYGGNRQQTLLDTTGIVGLDATSLLTLSFLNLLDMAFEAFDGVYLPHSTLSWLFEEKEKATFHQPSKIRDAHQVRDLLAKGDLERLVPSTVGDSEISALVGDDLALLIAESEVVVDDSDTQRIVVRSSPVHRVASLVGEEADLTDHAAVMSGCLPIVEKLRRNGHITAEEEKRARTYLRLHEKPWPLQPEIADGAVLYLDGLTITYFLHIGIFEKLRAAGFKIIASPREVSDVDALIEYEKISVRVNEAIESIRSNVNSRIESGKIKIGGQINSDKQSVFERTSLGAIALARNCDLIISDDRFLNQHMKVDDGNGQALIFSTLDLIDALASTGAMSLDDLFEYKTLLRRAGYFFVPLRDDELAHHLNTSTVIDDIIVETAEMKAIRENFLQVRMSNWLQIPKEAHWLGETLKVFIRVLHSLWNDDVDISIAKAKSAWILEQLDIRGWAHTLEPESGDNVVRVGRGAYIRMLFTPPSDVSQVVKDAYWSWVDEKILAPTKEQFPELYASIVEWQRSQISEMADMELTGSDAS